MNNPHENAAMFKLKYAPHIGSFTHSAGKDPIDQINYMADLGFKALEDSGFVSPLVQFNSTRMGIGMCSQTPEMLNKIGETLAKRGMEMGTFVLTPTKWPPIELVTSGKPEYLEEFLTKCKSGVEVAKRINAKFVTITLDCFDRSLPIEMQTAHAIDALRKASDIFEPIGVTMAIETLADHHELFLRTSAQAYMLCKAVNRDACKILFDMYHLQKNEGRLIYHIDMVWDEIGYFQIGDEPGRCEPGTGEINYKNIFKHIYQKSKASQKDFILGMEHFNSIDGIEGEQALLEAYKQADNFKNEYFQTQIRPHFGTFASAGSDLIDQIKYSADLGFTAFEDNAFSGVPMPNLMGIGMLGQTPEYLDKIGKTLSDLNMEMGTFVMGPVNWPPNAAFTSGKEEFRNIFLDKCRQAVEVGKRLNGKYVTVVPDAADPTLPYEIQTANVLESLKRAAEIFEPHGMVMLLEPLSFPPQVYLKTSAQCYLLAKAVNSPACKILFDLFHLQQNEGHLQRNIDLVWDEIGYFQIGDVPQRFEPGTGEINHEIVFKHIYQKSLATGKNFIFGMEHYNAVAGIAGEKAMLEAYQKLDNTLN